MMDAELRARDNKGEGSTASAGPSEHLPSPLQPNDNLRGGAESDAFVWLPAHLARNLQPPDPCTVAPLQC